MTSESRLSRLKSDAKGRKRTTDMLRHAAAILSQARAKRRAARALRELARKALQQARVGGAA